MTKKDIKSPYFHFFGDKDLEQILNYEEIWAVQKFAKGLANEAEQKFAFQTIVYKICRMTAPAFNNDALMQAFNEGMRFAGLLLAKARECDTESFKKSISTYQKNRKE